VCQNLAWDWLSSFFIHLSSFHHMALAAMLPSRTVSSSINYLMISFLLVQFSLQYFSYSVILITRADVPSFTCTLSWKIPSWHQSKEILVWK
jgi:hypothetical protein